MIGILFTIVLSGIHYTVTKNCSELAKTYYPVDDGNEVRVLYVCTDYPQQTRQLVTHELLHICMHNHEHHFKTREELDKHLHQQTYTEEYFATIVAPCLIENQGKLFRALEQNGEHIP